MDAYDRLVKFGVTHQADRQNDGRPFWYDNDDLLSNEEYLPCYSKRFSVYDWMNTKELIVKYIKLASAACMKEKVGMAVFSVTAKDGPHKLWLEVAKELGIIVVSTKSRHDGRYPCWMLIHQVIKGPVV